MPVVVLPQMLLCGLFVPRDQMAGWLQAISDVLPLTYAVEALQEVGRLADADRHDVAGRRHRGRRACSPSRWRRRPCGGGPAERRRRDTGPPVGTAPRQPGHPGGDPRRRPGRVRRAGVRRRVDPRRSRPRPASTRRWCTTTSAARTSCSSPRCTRRSTPPTCCPRCSPAAATARRRPSSGCSCGVWDGPAQPAGAGPAPLRRRQRVDGEAAARVPRHPGAAPRRRAPSTSTPTSAPPAASLVASQLIGLVMARYVLQLEPLASALAGLGWSRRSARRCSATSPAT